jgi:TPP-dependent pyruvate/acetoin dehydrogenase alpha subunit
MNLAAVWQLPVLFVCKDDQWAITTATKVKNQADIADRAGSLGLTTFEADGRDVLQVWDAANQAIQHARSGVGPAFLHADCVHLEGHFLGYQMIRVARDPLKEMPPVALPLMQSFLQPRGAGLPERLEGLKTVLNAILETIRDPRNEPANDPVKLTRSQLSSDPQSLDRLEAAIQSEIEAILDAALRELC